MQPAVRPALTSEKSKVAQTIMFGFIADPVARWIWPEPDAYLAHMPKFALAFGGRGFDHDTVYIAEDGKAAAMWLPPDVEPDEDEVEALVGETIPADRLEEVGELFAVMDEHHPQERCWYLPLIAADPGFTGQGLGAALMKHALRRCDEDNLPAYLESSNPRNMSLYERHGFEATGQIQVGSSPVLTPMLRMPAGSI